MSLASRSVSDICLLVADLEASVDFYHRVLGFEVAHRMPGFVDFRGPGVVLALWSADHISSATGAVAAGRPPAHAVMIAVRLESPDEVDDLAADLRQRGVEFVADPETYPWNARCAYFRGPDNELWELYAWQEGGAPGAV